MTGTAMSNDLFALSDLNSDFDGEPRIRDILLGERLGYERPRDVRKVIERNKKELGQHSRCATVARLVERSGRGVQRVDEYWLNEAQALLVCMFARTEVAAQVRKALVEIFMAWREGRVTPAEATPPGIEDSDDALNVMRAWVMLIREMRLVLGRRAAAAFWAVSPLPQPPGLEGAGPAETSPVDAFLAARVRRRPGSRLAAADLYAAYVAWAEGAGVEPVTMTRFGRELSLRGVTRVKGGRHWYVDMEVASPS